MKPQSNKAVLEWYDKLADNVKACCYLEWYEGRLFMCVNAKPEPKTICRVRRTIVRWFELKRLESQFVNVRYYGILKRLEWPKMETDAEILENTVAILPDLKDKIDGA